MMMTSRKGWGVGDSGVFDVVDYNYDDDDDDDDNDDNDDDDNEKE